MASPSFTINAGPVDTKESVTAATSVVCTLDDTSGVRQVAWTITRTDDTTSPASYAAPVISGATGETATFTSLGAGTAAIVKARINGGLAEDTDQPSDATSRENKFFVPLAGGQEVLCAGELARDDVVSSATHGAVEVINSTIRAPGSGESNTGDNVGAGTGRVFRDKTGVTINLKSLIGGTNVTVTDNADDITIDASGGSGTDADAIHDNVANEFTAVTFKATPVAADNILIEDSAAAFVKKSTTLTNLPFVDQTGSRTPNSIPTWTDSLGKDLTNNASWTIDTNNLEIKGPNVAQSSGDIRVATGFKITGRDNPNSNDADILEFTSADDLIIGDLLHTDRLTLTTSESVDIVAPALTFAEQAGDPGATANEGKLYTKDVSAVTELFYQDSGGTVRQITPPGSGSVGGTGTDNHVSRWDGAGDIQDSGMVLSDTDVLGWISTVAAPAIQQDTTSVVSATGAITRIEAQEADGATSTGGQLHLQAGLGNPTWGSVHLKDGGGTTRIEVTSGGVASLAQGAVQVTGSSCTLVAPTLAFSSTVVSPTVKQNSSATASDTGDTISVTAQDVTGTGTCVGGVALLKAGNATGAGTTNTGGEVLVEGGDASNAGTNIGGNVVVRGGDGVEGEGFVQLEDSAGNALITVGPSANTLGFHGSAATSQSAAYTRNATVVEDRTLLASASATATNNNNVLAALVADLQAKGILG